jgi:PadR family transcriptional regulator, regulatory protein PadR
MNASSNPPESPIEPQIFDSLRLELRRGCLIVAVLAIEESTLYPLLRRRETQKLLTSQWREEDKRNKRFYKLSPEGETILNQLLAEWNAINDSVQNILNHSNPR